MSFVMVYAVETAATLYCVVAPVRLTFRRILARLPEVPSFPLLINGYKVLARDSLDRPLPAEY